MPNGRPTKYNKEVEARAAKYAKAGLTNEQIAELIEVNVDTIYEWQKVHPSFSEALKGAKTDSDDRVVRSLFERATGYEHFEDKMFLHRGEIISERTTKHYPPDPTSMIFWLKNRRPDLWREKPEEKEEGDEGKMDMSKLSTEEITAYLAIVKKASN